MTINSKRSPKLSLLAGVRSPMWARTVLLLAAVTAATHAEEVERCMTNTTFKEQVVHFPVKWGLCVGCHKFENGDVPFTLRENIPKLCIGCHGMEMKNELGQTQPSIRSIFEAAAKPPEQGGLRLHKPFADGNCTCCHNPHTSSDRRMLDRPYPTANYSEFAPERYMCFKCHNEQAFAEPRTLDATRFRNGNVNLHYRHVNRDKGRSCRLCHEHHASTYDALIRKEAAFGTKTIPITEFSRTETGGSCAPTCHGPVKYDRIEPALNVMRVTPRKGEDVTMPELQQAEQRAKTTSTLPLWKAQYPPKSTKHVVQNADATNAGVSGKDAPKVDGLDAPNGNAPRSAPMQDVNSANAPEGAPSVPGADTQNGGAPQSSPKEHINSTNAPEGASSVPGTAAPNGDTPQSAPKEDTASTGAPEGATGIPRTDAPDGGASQSAPKEDVAITDAPAQQ